MDDRTRDALREREGKRPRNSPAAPAGGGQQSDLLGGIAHQVSEFASLSFLSPPPRPALQAEHRYEHHRAAAPAVCPELDHDPANKNDWEYFDPESQFPPWLPGLKVPKSSMRSPPHAWGGEGGGGGRDLRPETRDPRPETREGGGGGSSGDTRGHTAGAPPHQGDGVRPMAPDPDAAAAGSAARASTLESSPGSTAPAARALVEAAMAATGEGPLAGDTMQGQRRDGMHHARLDAPPVQRGEAGAGEGRRGTTRAEDAQGTPTQSRSPGGGDGRGEGKVKDGLRETAWIRSSEFTVVVDVGVADAPRQVIILFLVLILFLVRI